MDVSELNKIAQRKKLNANAEKLREKIAKENKNILKLRVAQDTAYWDVKEQLRQVEGNHEKLQANMVEVQMQHEALSGQYQEELRRRPETLNKLNSTRQICDVLEGYTERLRDTLSRCKEDQTALYDAYNKSAQVLRDIKTQQIVAGEKNHQLVENLQEKIKLTSEHNAQMLQFFGAEKQRADTELVDVKSRLEAALVEKNELLAAGNELTRKTDQQKHELQKKEEAILYLQSDIKKLVKEFNIQGTDMQNTIVKQEKELKETTSAIESLKQALTNQESFTKSICDQNNHLQERIAVLEEEHANLSKEHNSQMQNVTATINSLKTKLATATNDNEAYNKEITEKTQIIKNAESDIQKLKQQLSVVEAEKLEIVDELNKTVDAAEAATVTVDQLTSAVQALEVKLVETEENLHKYSEASETKIKELTAANKEKDEDLNSKVSTISHLMSEVKSETDARCKLDAAVQRLKKEMEADRLAAGERDMKYAKQIDGLETSVRNKESELSNQLTIILELRSDKERLHDKIGSMQNKIDNIHKELTSPHTRAPRHVPEHDDNAIMFTPTPTPKPTQGNKKTTEPRANTPGCFAVPYNEKAESLVLNFLDSSTDGDNVLDPAEVTRRFEALSRGERLSPTPLSALKRRRSGVPSSQARRGLVPEATNDRDGIPLAQLKGKERMFFKNIRQRPKKAKQADLF